MFRITRRFHAALPLLALPVALSIAPTRSASGQRVVNPSSNQLLSPFRFRNIGPASMGGRIDDIEVSESDPNIIYLGYAVGGVWKSNNHGVSYEPVFDEQT